MSAALIPISSAGTPEPPAGTAGGRVPPSPAGQPIRRDAARALIHNGESEPSVMSASHRAHVEAGYAPLSEYVSAFDQSPAVKLVAPELLPPHTAATPAHEQSCAGLSYKGWAFFSPGRK